MAGWGDDDWRAAILSVPDAAVVEGQTFIKAWQTWSRPVAVHCDDSRPRVVKGVLSDPRRTQETKRALISENVVGVAGRAIGAPIPEIVLVDLGADLIDNEPNLQHIQSGLCHGSLELDNCGQSGITAPTTDRNRDALASLAVLYGWAIASDHQIIAKLDAAADIYSVDHGLFLPGAQNWSTGSLQTAPAVQLDQVCAQHVPAGAIERAIDRLAIVSDAAIAGFVAGPPDSWGVTETERLELAKYLSQRRDTLVGQVRGE
jgi:hypothetical protein